MIILIFALISCLNKSITNLNINKSKDNSLVELTKLLDEYIDLKEKDKNNELIEKSKEITLFLNKPCPNNEFPKDVYREISRYIYRKDRDKMIPNYGFENTKEYFDEKSKRLIINFKNSSWLHKISYNIKYVEILLELDVDINEENEFGETLLHKACSDGNLELARLLVNKGINVNKKDKRLEVTPIFFAVKECNRDIFTLLLKNKANLKIKDKEDKTLFHYLSFDFLMDVNDKNKALNRIFLDLIRNIYDLLDEEDIYKKTFYDYFLEFNKILRIRGKKFFQFILNGLKLGTESIFHKLLKDYKIEIEELEIRIEEYENLEKKDIKLNILNNKGEKFEVNMEEIIKANNYNLFKFLHEHLSFNINNYKHILILHCIKYIKLETTLLKYILSNIKNSENFGIKYLYYSCFFENYESFKIFLNKIKNFNESIIPLPWKTYIYSGEIDIPSIPILQYAIKKNNTKMVEKLVENGIGVDKKLEYIPLIEACRGDSKEIVSLILEKEVDINAREKEDKTALIISSGRPFLSSISHSNEEIVEMLLNKGARVDARDKYGITALMYAAERNNEKVINLLLENGANIDDIDHEGCTALMHSIGNKFNSEMIRQSRVNLLLERGADINIKDKKGNTALMIACERGDKKIVELLLRKGASLDKDLILKNITLSKACEIGNIEIVKLFLENSKNKIGMKKRLEINPLEAGTTSGNLELVNFLIENDYDVNEKNSIDGIALHEALWNNDMKMVNLLIEKGSNINNEDKNGENPLIIASTECSIEIISLLIEKGANVNYKNRHGDTALGSLMNNVIRGNQKEVAKLLIEKGANPLEGIKDLNLSISSVPLYRTIEEESYINDILPILLTKIENKDKKSFLEYCSNLKRFENLNSVFKKVFDSVNSDEKKEFINLCFLNILRNNNINKISIAEFLLNTYKEYIDIDGSAEGIPLLIAINNKNIELIKILVKNGANINNKDKNDRPLIYYVLKKCDKELLILYRDLGIINKLTEPLLNYYIEILTELNKNSYEFKKLSDKDFVKFLNKEMYLSLNEKNEKGETTLHIACINENKKIIKLLIRLEADINSKNKEGDTPLHLAIKLNNLSILKLIISKEGIDINAINEKGQTALIVSILEIEDGIERDEIIDKLLEAKADVSVRYGLYGDNTLMLAIRKKDFYTAEKILKYNIELDAQNLYEETALMLALKENIQEEQREKLIEILINKADMDKKNIK